MQLELDLSEPLPPVEQARMLEGMRQADENADSRWKHIFDGAVLAAARRLAELTSDDVLEEIEALPNHPETHNLAAIGPAMMRAAAMGVLTHTDQNTRSKRDGKHGNRHTVWKSNYYKG